MQKIDLNSLTAGQKESRIGILKLAHEAHHAHIGSCLTSVDLIDAVYKTKEDSEKFVLSNGHAGMALYVILQKYGKIKDANIIKDFYIHPDRNITADIHVSTGSLGQGLPIALGMAFANKEKDVYCLISDGECAEGSIWETIRIAVDNKVTNLKIILDANGWGGYDPIESKTLRKRLRGFGLKVIDVYGHDLREVCDALKIKSDVPILIFARTTVNQFPFLKGQDAHYYVMSKDDYNLATQLLK